jgi:hypothetical protein
VVIRPIVLQDTAVLLSPISQDQVRIYTCRMRMVTMLQLNGFEWSQPHLTYLCCSLHRMHHTCCTYIHVFSAILMIKKFNSAINFFQGRWISLLFALSGHCTNQPILPDGTQACPNCNSFNGASCPNDQVCCLNGSCASDLEACGCTYQGQCPLGYCCTTQTGEPGGEFGKRLALDTRKLVFAGCPTRLQ